MELIFPYQEPSIHKVEIPDGRLVAMYDVKDVPPSPDVTEDIRRALANPVGTRRLGAIVRPESTVALIVDDYTRGTPASLIIPHLLTEIHEAGCPRQNVTIVMAIGSHRPMTTKEIEHKIGKEIASSYRVINSRYDDPAHQVYMGKAPDGVEVYVDEAVGRATVRIGVGSIVPHAGIGWSGGGKILYPGVASKRTVTSLHFNMGLSETIWKGDENCYIRGLMEQWVDTVGLDFIVNCVLTADMKIYKVRAGHYVHAHREALKYSKEIYTRKIKERTDIVICTSYPHDFDFWVAPKGIYSGSQVVKRGGTVLLVSPCPEGVGPHPSACRTFGRDNTVDELRDIVAGRVPMPEDAVVLCPATLFARMRRECSIAVVSPGLTREQMSQAKMEYFSDAQTGVDTLLGRYPQGKVSYVAHGDLTFVE